MKAWFAILENKFDWANGNDYMVQIKGGFKTRTEAEADYEYIRRLNEGRDVFVHPVQ